MQYLLAVDTINFCFWPQPGLEYEHLARGFKVVCLWLLLLAYLTSLSTSGQRLQSFAEAVFSCWLHKVSACFAGSAGPDLAVHRCCLELKQCLSRSARCRCPALTEAPQHDMSADAGDAACGRRPASAQSMGHVLS